jgi:predicted nucleic acid-binding Zn ribbon protein
MIHLRAGRLLICYQRCNQIAEGGPTPRAPYVPPISIRRRGGRKLVLAPDGTNVTAEPVRRHIDNAMVKAIARAFRWREMLENGTHATIGEIAAAEKINETYVGRVLRLTRWGGERADKDVVRAPFRRIDRLADIDCRSK